MGNSGTCTLSNLAGALFEITGNGDLAFCNNTAVFDNDGTLRRTTRTGTLLLGLPVCGGGTFTFNNRGLVEVQSGILGLIAINGTAQDTGAFRQTIAQIDDLMKRDGEAQPPTQVAAAMPASTTPNG